MSGSYEIQELVHQDDGGVVFEATGPDGSKVALHRFFLPEKALAHYRDHPEAFHDALAELQNLASETLRPVIAGGIDPEDRTPWVALPWQTGRTLASALNDKDSLSEMEALAVWQDGKQAISHLGEQARQISLDPQEIILTTTDGHPGASYMIAIRRWFLTHSGAPPTAPDPLPVLTELYRSLAQEKKSSPPPPKPRNSAALPIRPAPLASASSSGSTWPLAVCLVLLLALGAGTWIYLKTGAAGVKPASADPAPTSDPAAPNPDQPAGPEVLMAAVSTSPVSPEGTGASAEIVDVSPAPMEPVSPVLDLPEGHFRPENQAAITARMKEEVTLVGVVQSLGESNSKKTLYLNFGWAGKVVNAQALLSRSEGLSREILATYNGKKVALVGTVTRNSQGQTVVEFNSISDLQIVDP